VDECKPLIAGIECEIGIGKKTKKKKLMAATGPGDELPAPEEP
jgi:hypothetical protein